MATFQSCAYYSTWPNKKAVHSGVTVLDASDSRHPKVTAYLNTPAMLNANESLLVDSKHKLLFASLFNGSVFDVYDLSADCRHPVLKSSLSIPQMTSHIGQLAPDGRTLYGASCCTGPESALKEFPLGPGVPPSALFAIDTSDPSRLRGIATWIPPEGKLTHAVSVNRDGTRAYVGLVNGGLLVLDVGDIQARRDGAQYRLISALYWVETAGGQTPLPVTIAGRPYLVLPDIVGSVINQKNPCIPGKPGHGFARIIDISDEKSPKVVSKLMLEVSTPANCANVQHDPVTIIGYGSVYCDVDDAADAKLLVCAYFEAGVRVFDIRDPMHPREVAYYKPAAPRTGNYPASIVRNLWPEVKDHTADQVWQALFRNDAQEIWFMSSGRGFHVVRFSDRFRASNPDLF
jgi:hypothetical protein